jgi:hypothetical protein
MTGCFGLAEYQHDQRTPLDQLVEAHPVVDVFQLYRLGLLAPGASAVLETGPVPCQVSTDGLGNLSLDGQPIRVVPHVALPLRAFECRCGALRYRLYRVNSGEWLCRLCAKVDYACRHRHRSVPGYWRAVQLRKRIGAPERLFTPIEPKPLQARRYLGVVLKIRKIEEGLVEHLRTDVTAVLERRDHAKRRRR